MEFLEVVRVSFYPHPQVLQEAQICDVPLLFVLDHFSTFCNQSKQTLLYTLLDLCSNKNVQICIIGVDRDCCISELLEKRIQSRSDPLFCLTSDFPSDRFFSRIPPLPILHNMCLPCCSYQEVMHLPNGGIQL